MHRHPCSPRATPRPARALALTAALLGLAGCGRPPAPVAIAPVASTSAPVLACGAGRADCDGRSANGCEANLASEDHCGACGVACAMGQACESGACHDRPRAVTHVALGERQGCAALSDGQVWCWGDEHEREAASPAPSRLPGVERAEQVALASFAGCARQRGGSLVCWRWPERSVNEPIGIAPMAPAVVKDIAGVTSVVGTTSRLCALREGGSIVCWQDNQTRFTPWTTVARARLIAGGGSDLCVATAERIECWNGHRGQAHQAVVVENPGEVTELAIHGRELCALRPTGRVACWSAGGMEIRLEGEPRKVELTEVPDLADVVSIAAGDYHVCATQRGGATLCWGDNDDGELGVGKLLGQIGTPTRVVGLDDARGVAAGPRSTCATTRTGRLRCWGRNEAGQLGTGVDGYTRQPREVRGVSDAVGVFVSDVSSYAIDRRGEVHRWGGMGASLSGFPEPTERLRSSDPEAMGLSNVAWLMSDFWVGYAVRRNGEMLHFAQGSSPIAGQGLGAWQPERVEGLRDVRAMNITNDLLLGSGQLISVLGLGNGAYTFKATNVRRYRGLGDLTGMSTQCGVRRSGKVVCWDRDHRGVEVSLPSPARAVAATFQGGCALDGAGVVSCWQIDERPLRLSPPESVPLPAPAVALAASHGTRCAVLATGQVACWSPGNEPSPAPTLAGSPGPRIVPGLGDAVAISLSSGHACAVRRGGQVSCWGSNSIDQTGSVDDLPFSASPLDVKLPLP